jgi:hypothetical protein
MKQTLAVTGIVALHLQRQCAICAPFVPVIVSHVIAHQIVRSATSRRRLIDCWPRAQSRPGFGGLAVLAQEFESL